MTEHTRTYGDSIMPENLSDYSTLTSAPEQSEEENDGWE
jgi:hypothetical protein